MIPICQVMSLCHQNHFHLYHRNPNSQTRSQFRTLSNQCKYVLKNVKDQYENMIELCIEAESLGSCEFWRIANRVLNCGKSIIATIINGPEILSSASDKATLFVKNFAANSNLHDTNHVLPNFPSHTDIQLSDFFITAKEVSKLHSSLETSKAVGPDGPRS